MSYFISFTATGGWGAASALYLFTVAYIIEHPFISIDKENQSTVLRPYSITFLFTSRTTYTNVLQRGGEKINTAIILNPTQAF